MKNVEIFQDFIRERDYTLNRNPLEALEEGEEYSSIQIDALAHEEYSFEFQLTYENDKSVKESIVWLHMGFMPKSETEFLNEKAVLEDNTPIYFESLGTEEYTSLGPGKGPHKMFGRPEVFALEEPIGEYTQYAPYIWTYAKTDVNGKARFNVSLDHDLIEDYNTIFGEENAIDSVEEITLYMRAFSSYFDWDEMKISTPDQYICAQEGLIFDGTHTLENYNFTELLLQDTTYAEGIIRVHPGDIALGVGNRLKYPLTLNATTYDPITINLFASEADPIPKAQTTTLSSLTTLHDAQDLEPLPINILNDNHTYIVAAQIIDPNGDPIVNPHSQDNSTTIFYYPIETTFEGGKITISNETMALILDDLGVGMSTIQLQILESPYYKYQ